VDCQNLLYKHQYRVRAKHSPIHPVLHMLNQCKYILSILYDRSIAFDVINHDILLKKLHFYGIRGIVNKGIVNYL